MAARTKLARGVRRAMDVTGAPNVTELCDLCDMGPNGRSQVTRWLAKDEPRWLCYLRAIRRVTGLSWEELLG